MVLDEEGGEFLEALNFAVARTIGGTPVARRLELELPLKLALARLRTSASASIGCREERPPGVGLNLRGPPELLAVFRPPLCAFPQGVLLPLLLLTFIWVQRTLVGLLRVVRPERIGFTRVRNSNAFIEPQ